MSRHIVLLALLAVALFAGCRRGEQLPILYALPGETPLVSMEGKPVQLASMRGNVVIYNFIFTRCAGVCPLLTKRMQEVAGRIDRSERVRFASISVDPVNDTPAVLSHYAKSHGADERWSFFTGERNTIIDLSIRGFKLAAGQVTTNQDEPILHSSKFVLTDGAGNIRGYYDSNEATALDQLAKDAVRLTRELR